jgi:serine/threonine-protein kinase
MGEVYRARDTRLGREVAVKVLPEQFASDPQRRARFEAEARAVAALSHPNILALYDYGTDGAVTYVVLELLEGATLRDRLAKGPLPWREAVACGAAIAEGLAAAHAKGIIHRDLKPENLFLTTDGRVKILDFGLARISPSPDPQSDTGPYIAAATDAGTVLGTAGYMAPEQVRGQTADARSDLFSFGCVLYEMVTGRRAFQRETSAETMTAILHDEPPNPTVTAHPVPAELARVIRQCLAKDPHQRLQSSRDLALALRMTASDPGLHPPRPPGRLRPLIVGMIGLILLITVGAAAVYFLTKDPHDPATEPHAEGAKAGEAVAVLPFENVGNDPATEYLSDGLADHLIQSLSQVRRNELQVRPFTSVARFKGKLPDFPAIAQKLNVHVIVTGAVHQQSGDKLAFRVYLVDARADSQLWSNSYEGQLGEILDLQGRIAEDLAAQLRLPLNGEEEKRLTKRPTTNKDAYLLYRKGRHAWSIRTEDKLKLSIEYFQQALEKDPDYALAHAGMADSYSSLGSWGSLPPRTVFPRARKAAEEALALDPTLAEAHTSLGYIKLHFDWDWPAAEAAFQRAITLDPQNANGYHWYAHCLIVQGRTDEALAASKRALELDPIEPNITGHLGWHYYYVRDYDRAIEYLRPVVEMDSKGWSAHRLLAMVYAQKARYPEALVEVRAGTIVAPDKSTLVAMLGYIHGVSGNKREAQNVLDRLTELAKQKYVSPYDLAVVHMGLGQDDEAVAELRKACAERSPHLILLRVEPIFDRLRSDPRFAQVLNDMSKPPS